jgi:hypothetical protein
VTALDRARWYDYGGLFLVALATLMLEILLTRIFSVTLWYHLAFVAVSVAMFGMTLGAVIVYLAPSWFTPGRLRTGLAISAALFGISAVWSVQAQLETAIDVAQLQSPLRDLSLAYGIAAVPFMFSGIAVSLALTRFPFQISRLYAADLAGAALGCIALIPSLEWLGGPHVVIVVAGVAAAAAVLFALGSSLWRLPRRFSLHGSLGLLTAVALLIGFVWTIDGALDGGLEIRRAKGYRLNRPLYEKWNSYSRIAVLPLREERPFGWGLSRTFQPRFQVGQYHLNIDASAETVLTQFDPDLTSFEHLRYDVTNIAHYLTKGGNVFVVGAGGGRDVLSALVFDQKHVTAVEMNRAIIDAVNGAFGDITGHLDRNPKVQFVNDEARSFLTRADSRFDLIQISLIDTWAATAAGAFVLSENTLYTAEAWELFWRRLTDSGLLSVSRWYNRPAPFEVYKLTALATDALRRVGVQDPRKHLILVATRPDARDPTCCGDVATLLVRRTPFSESDIATIESVAGTMAFEVLLSPRHAINETFARLTDAQQTDAEVARLGAGLAPPTDDRPFFFKMDSTLLNGLFQFVTVLALVFVVVPVAIKAERGAISRDLPCSIAFVAIGLAFMLIEISLMQRLTLLLGHPTFSLSVVLAGLLVSSGAGSFSTQSTNDSNVVRRTSMRLVGLLVVLVVIGAVASHYVNFFSGSATAV